MAANGDLFTSTLSCEVMMGGGDMVTWKHPYLFLCVLMVCSEKKQGLMYKQFISKGKPKLYVKKLNLDSFSFSNSTVHCYCFESSA